MFHLSYFPMLDREMRMKLLSIAVFTSILVGSESLLQVDITYVHSAVPKGGVCLDGSPPAYHFSRGFGSGTNNWLVHLEGGAWCYNREDCKDRSNNELGSSKYMSTKYNFTGLLSNRPFENPDFYNWNRVFVRYCDGSSFTGNKEEVDPVTNVYYRGKKVFSAVMADLLYPRGMRTAQNAILSGVSAGGLAAVIHCDGFSSLFYRGTRVKCLIDAGIFINTKTITGETLAAKQYNEVLTTHGSLGSLPLSCTLTMKPSLCFFPQYLYKGIRTPIFMVNSAYDKWQIYNRLIPCEDDPCGIWTNCTNDISNCKNTQLHTIQGFRSEFINTLNGLKPWKDGYFITSCYAHVQNQIQKYWFGPNSIRLNGKTIAEAVGDWFYERSLFNAIDNPYPYSKCDTKQCEDYICIPCKRSFWV